LKPQEGEMGESERPADHLSDGLAASGPNCPPLEDWGMYAAALLPEKKAVELMGHAAECAACGGLLADLTETAEEAEMPNLKSATEKWKQQMAARLEGKPSPQGRILRFPLFRKWPLAVAATLLMSVLAGTSSTSVLWLLAHSGNRPNEFRLHGMSYQSSERGAATNADSSSFLLAKLLIAIRDKTGMAGPSWQHARARAALLDEGGSARLEAAIDALGTAHSVKPEDAAIANDLAVALLLRGTSEQNAGQTRTVAQTEDVARAIEALVTGLKARPGDASLYFNLAIAYEELKTYDAALAAWREFLKLEPAGGWADEANKRIEALTRRQRVRAAAGVRKSEDVIFDLAAQKFQSSERLDASAIEADMADGHKDAWLRDLRLANAQLKTGNALDLLSAGVQALNRNRRDAAEPLLREALATFSRAGNTPASVFAAYELAFALFRAGDRAACVSLAHKTLPTIIAQNYRWLELHFRVTLGLCQGLARDFEAAYASVATARDVAAAAGYTSRELYVLAMASGILREVGSYREALPLDVRSVERYWAGEGARSDAYQSYMGYSTSLAGLQYTQASLAALGEAVKLAEKLPNRSREGLARARYGEMLADASRLPEASLQFARSKELFDNLPAADDRDKIYARLSRARFDGQEGKFAEGLDAVAEMESLMASRQNPAIETQLWYVKADLLARKGDLLASERSLTQLLAIADAARSSTPSAADRSAMARRVSQAVDLLADRYIAQGKADDAWRIWTRYNNCFTTIDSNKTATRLIYTTLPSGPVALVSNGAGVRAVKLTGIAEIAQLARDVRQLLANPNSSISQLRTQSRRLEKMVVSPLADHLKNQRVLYVSATPPFSAVPFAALVTSDGGWLADRFQINYSPPIGGAGARGGTGEASITPDKHLLAVGYGGSSEIFGNRLPALSFDIDEDLRASAAVFPKHTVLSETAHLGVVLERMRGAQIFQFSGHAVTVSDDTGLVLAPGGSADVGGRLLWASQLSADTVKNVQLAVLAACSTGRPADEHHSPGSDMARSFLVSGVPLVLASSWDVDSRATTELVRTFYAGFARPEPLSPEAAAADAAAALRRKESFKHPYYWAAFALYRR
jgi:CHAT domain-containing protein/tetratricopeptide (TPR) repeat protein